MEPEASVDLFTKRYFTLPAVDLLSIGGGRRNAGGSVAIGRGLTFVGVGATIGVVIEDRTWVPALHLEVATVVGRSPAIVTGFDGSIGEVHPWTGKHVALHMLGIGARAKHRRWMVEGSLMPGLSAIWMSASYATADDATATNALLISFSLRAELTGCRRLDPVTRVCVVLAPNVYEHGFFNGGALGLRWEVGP